MNIAKPAVDCSPLSSLLGLSEMHRFSRVTMLIVSKHAMSYRNPTDIFARNLLHDLNCGNIGTLIASIAYMDRVVERLRKSHMSRQVV